MNEVNHDEVRGVGCESDEHRARRWGERNLFPLNLPTVSAQVVAFFRNGPNCTIGSPVSCLTFLTVARNVSGQLLLDGFEYVYSHRQETSYTTASVTVVIILPKIMPIRTKYV